MCVSYSYFDLHFKMQVQKKFPEGNKDIILCLWYLFLSYIEDISSSVETVTPVLFLAD